MERGNRKSRVGVVVSNKMDKTVVVKVERRVPDREVRQDRHPGQEVQGARREARVPAGRQGPRSSRRRPMSKDKRWRVVEVIEKAAEV